ncbi:MAG: M48 family metalloprotease [Proteobacteria bacterium]|nr:M48 family metalloprotease [Pseudomonadota bacterium]
MYIFIKYAAIRNLLAFSFISLVLFAVVGCATNPVTGQSQFMLVSEEQEIQIGKELYPNAMWGAEGGGGEFKDERVKAYLKNVVLNIHKVSHRPNLPVDFAIQNSSVPNAWAIPGHVVITRGLLAGLDNEAEFAFVMGHEMGHVSARHSASQMSLGILHQTLLAGAGIALAGSDYSDATLSLGALGSSLLLLKYSRVDELEADGLGVQYMTKLGYNPKNAVSAHMNLEKVSNEYMKSLGKGTQERGFFEDLLSTHPRTSVRIDEIQNIINHTSSFALKGDGVNRQEFQTMIAGTKNINNTYIAHYDKAVRALNNKNLDEAVAQITKAINIDQTQAPFYSLSGFIMLRKKNPENAEKYFNYALRLDNNYQPALRGMGAIRYIKGNYAESMQYLKKSIALFPEDMHAHYFLGMSYFKTNTYKTALNHLKLFADTHPKHPEIHGVLGTCYENVNDPSSAYKEYAMQLKVAPNSDMGKRAAGRLQALGVKVK